MKFRAVTLGAVLILVLSSCAMATGEERPTDAKLRDGINLLLTNFTARHPELRTWDASAVKHQIAAPLPKGLATEAGWTLSWSNATSKELSRVVIPWTILGQYPNHFALDSARYTGGKAVPDSVAIEIRKIQQGSDEFFAAIVHLRFSSVDPTWLIFESVPYLPVTDNAYGWAHLRQGKWAVIDFGTATVGCGRVSTAIQKEFGMDCPT
ncbi:MAG: hypothetical protein WCO08_00710 [Actinomycetes bacterium]